MRIRVASSIQLIFLMLTAQAGMSADPSWELRRDRDGIQIYTRDVADSPYDAVRSETVIRGVSLSALVALVEDVEACPDWASRCAESYVVERISPSEAYVYNHNNMPFPVKDRDVVAHVQWRQDAESLTVEMHSRATTGKLDEVRGRLRLTQAQASWRFDPLADDSIAVSNEAHINPGSALPAWVVNMLLVDTPFDTLQAFVEEVQQPRYLNAEVSFIRDN